jgi:hypothetical protein
MTVQADVEEALLLLRRFRMFRRALRTETERFELAKDDEARARAGHASLLALNHFLSDDPEITDGRLLRPLAFVEKLFFDAAAGAKPAALNPVIEIEKDGKLVTRKGKASSCTSQAQTQGWGAFMLEALVSLGMGVDQSAPWLAKIAAQRGLLCEDGKPVVDEQFRNWRYELRREKGLVGARETFRALRKDKDFAWIFKAPKSEAKLEYCKKLVEGWMEGLAQVSPYSAPNRRTG